VPLDPTSVSLFPAKRKHLASMHRAFDAIAREKRYFVRPRAPSRSRLKQLLVDAEKRDLPFYIAAHDGQVVGWVAISFSTIEPLAHTGTIVMGVRREYRRLGIGKRLLARAIEHAFQDDTRRRLQLEVFGDNAAAIGLYESFGFQIEGVARGAVSFEGELRDVVHMARLK
jgi:RimJ/RimL family protein N-acetyltransferase